MKALVYTKYGTLDELELAEVEKPTPKEGEVLVKIHAASVNAADWRIIRAEPFLARLGTGLLKPKHTIPGSDIAGRVEAVGPNISEFQPGDEVYGDLSEVGRGGFAEYVAVPESALAKKPSNLTFEEAAALPMAAVTALQGLRDEGNIQPGQKVLIVGASGGVGTFAVQLAKYFGAEVTAVCSTSKMEMARELGADHVIDYTQEDVTKSTERYDLIFVANGYYPLSAYKQLLTANGKYRVAGGPMKQLYEVMFLGPWMSRNSGHSFKLVSSKPNKKELNFIKEIVETGKVKPIVERQYPLHEGVEAVRYVEAGHARGKIVITMP